MVVAGRRRALHRWRCPNRVAALGLACGVCVISAPGWSQERDPAGPFAQGRVRVSLLVGSGSTATDTYFVVGGGLGYFLADGLQLGLDYDAWLFGDPTLHRLSPELRYVFHMLPALHPYVGTFYRHTFVSRFDDLDHVGGRAGAYLQPDGPVYVGGGVVYERVLGCDLGLFVDCDAVYPELAIGFSF